MNQVENTLDASEAGLKPGDWPMTFILNQVPLIRVTTINDYEGFEEEEFMGYVYMSKDATKLYYIYND